MGGWRRSGCGLGLAALVLSLTVAQGASGAAAPVKLVAAGDIACGPGDVPSATECQQNATAALVMSLHPTALAPLGDNQYEDGTASDFTNFWAPSWGQLKFPTHPVPGNHEYKDPAGNAAGYYSYFGAAAGDPTKGYYSYNLGPWHVIALNSNCNFVSCGAGSPQERFLRSDLAAHKGVCTLAYWHHPLFTTGETEHDSNNAATVSFWRDLYAHHADLVVTGHDHDYQRYPPQTPAGAVDKAQGIREIVAGTGGRSLFEFEGPPGDVEVRNNQTFGVLELTLSQYGYTWQFFPTGVGGFTDSGSGTCHETKGIVKLARTVKVKLKTARVTARSHCSNLPGDRCSVALVLRGKHRVKVGTASGTIAGGKTGTLRYKLTTKGRKLLARAGGHKLKVTTTGTSKNKIGQATAIGGKLTLKRS